MRHIYSAPIKFIKGNNMNKFMADGDETITTSPESTITSIANPQKVYDKKACMKCGKEFEVRAKKNFCSRACRYRYFSVKEYHKIKDNPEFKARRKAYEKSWREKNKDRWNASMKLASQRYRANHPKVKPLVEQAPIVEEQPNGNM